MTDEPDDRDECDLKEFLRTWEVPAPSDELEQRLRQSYRERTKAASAWRWVRGGRVVLPAPLAALIVIALLLVGAAAGRRASPHPVESHAPSGESRGGLANLTALPEVRVTVMAEGASDADR